MNFRDKTDESTLHNPSEVLKAILPSGSFMSRDMLARYHRGCEPRRINRLLPMLPPSFFRQTSAMELSQIARQAGSHLSRLECKILRANLVGTNVVIGHGRSPAWKDLKRLCKRTSWAATRRIQQSSYSGRHERSALGSDAGWGRRRPHSDDLPRMKEQRRKDPKPGMPMLSTEVGLFRGRLGFDKAIYHFRSRMRRILKHSRVRANPTSKEQHEVGLFRRKS